MQTILDIPYSDFEETKLDIYLPKERSFPVFLYFHGGGLGGGSRKKSVEFISYLTERGIAVVTADYRMYPTAKYPDFIEDAAAAVAWTKAHIGEYGDCRGLFVGGSSAGGYLSMMLCFDKSYLGRHGIDPTALAGFVHDAGQPTCHFNVLNERGFDRRRVMIDDSAPLYHIGVDREYAPMHFIVSDNDMEGRYDQTMLLLTTLKHFRYDQSKISHTVMHGTHCAYVHGDEAFPQIIFSFINKVLA